MFITTTHPPIFQHTAMTSTMALHVPASGYGRYVALVRTLRDGSVTREYLPEFLAELVVATIPFNEPLVASARIAYSELRPYPDQLPRDPGFQPSIEAT